MDTNLIPYELYKDSPLLSRLLTLSQIPEKIYIRGSLPKIIVDSYGRGTPRILTVVGSRDHSSYAKEVLAYLISSLKDCPVIILSGLAIGIDSLAHEYALLNNILTIAIPGSGLRDDVLYPRSSERLAKEILYAHGALLSEFPDDTKSAKWMFLARNRLMAALADAVLIIEAKENSGTLVTARHALELGKSIGCVTGSLFSDFNKGSNELVRDGATPIMSKEDIFSLLCLPGETEEKPLQRTFLDKEDELLFSLLGEPRSKSELLALSNLPPQVFLRALTSLELQGLITTSLHEVRKLV